MSLHVLYVICIVFLCVSVLLGVCEQWVEVFIWMTGHSDSTNHLPAPQLFVTILFIYDKKREKSGILKLCITKQLPKLQSKNLNV